MVNSGSIPLVTTKLINIITMSKIKFTYNKVYKYIKGKSVIELMLEAYTYGFLMPLAIGGILYTSFMLITGQLI